MLSTNPLEKQSEASARRAVGIAIRLTINSELVQGADANPDDLDSMQECNQRVLEVTSYTP